MKKDGKNLGYGITGEAFSYPAEPDVTDVPCHFNVSDTGTMEQTEDANEYIVVGKLNLPYGTDVRVNDKIIELGSGISYYAEVPRNIRDHHIIVQIQRKGKVKGVM
jgi:hypothetical protein